MPEMPAADFGAFLRYFFLAFGFFALAYFFVRTLVS